ncbi:MAG: adenylate kinase family protein [Thermosphaera sp.]
MGKAIIIAGVPGTGKSTIASKLAEALKTISIDLSRFAIENNLILSYDEFRRTFIIDEDRVSMKVREVVEGSSNYIVLDTHYPEIIDPGIVEKVVVLRLHPLELEKRLSERGWSREKINENVMAEILGIVSVNAVEAFGEDKVYEVDASGKSVDEVLATVMEIVNNTGKIEPGLRVNWLEEVQPEVLDRFENYGGGVDGF